MTAETQLILTRIDGLERSLNTRIEDLRADTKADITTLKTSVDIAARDALAGRLVAEEASTKVGRVHEAQKATTTQVAKLVAVDSALTKYGGHPLRWKAVIVFLLGVGTLEWLFHRFMLR